MDEMYHCVLLSFLLVALPRSGALPVLKFFTSRKSAFSPCRATAPSHVKRDTDVGTWVRLAVQNVAPIGAWGGNAAPKVENFYFLAKSRLAWENPLTDFYSCYGFYTPNYPTLAFYIRDDSLYWLQSYC